ncbi:extracellular solute-binding protein [Schwartzia succinivorans]|jgi:iron(III) transport system substrate-binding protein|uniref:Iron(III) transport system substrate-binding protein n=1 Tax=Schwartzia succinivorans DSM 10502 TaxID=1123243 RepID=A0A1M4YZF5_9FIRM|nr:extracellular solute-binding protein [Schwartzia succinivorans]MBQ1469844.1 extracellular solute-binding protein [Schwartzia sp. (in: firmicutes)]MBQ1917726.1 extracellular solute-binding protein [Schwartzia sp. (in: firmicutes)]MBQ3863458.1 extracellular solute-binding protein [Schwartzia sp. (in: firmicutes)]MDY6295706.1 extracellular solute-binding protein [Schwartzia succinivorans]SHF11085.1 iron(III) transport system substrate-binding protein [Schwartzia succinivorans DSM 10502]
MKKSFLLLGTLLCALAMLLGGCGGGDKKADAPKGGDKELTVYTARSESLNNAVIQNFEKDTGIKVNVVVAGTGEVVKRVASEKANPLGDILWAGSEAMLASKKDLFQEYVSPEDKNMMPEFRNTTKFFTPAFSDPTVMIVNTDMTKDMKIEGFADLLNPALKGKIAFGDPVNSSSAFQSLVVMLYDMGNGEPFSEGAWNYVDKFLAQLQGKMSNSSSQVYKGVAGGEYAVGLTWEDPAASLVKSGAHVKVVFPKEGALYAPQSVQIIKNCKHPENAKKFIDYMLSEKIQNLVGTTLTVRPLRQGAKLADYMTPADKIKIAPKFDEKWVSENKDKFTKMFTEHLEKSM